MYTDLEKAILSVIVYFDFLGYPLSLMELIKWVESEADIIAIKKILAADNLSDKIESRFGFYYWRGRQGLIKNRLSCYSLADGKYKKAVCLAKVFKYFPFIRSIAVCGSLSSGNAAADSDIDLFVVAADNHVWTARFFLNSFLKIFGLRSSGPNKKDKICCSFFTGRANQDLSQIEHYKNEIHFGYWLAQFNFIYGNQRNDFENNNDWLKQKLPNLNFNRPNRRRMVFDAWLSQIIRGFLELIFGFGFWEMFFRWLQIKIMPANYKKLAQSGQEVIINEQMIKTHADGKARDINRFLAYKLNDLGIYE